MDFRQNLINSFFIIILFFISSFAIVTAYWVWENVKEERYADLEKTALFLNSYYELSFYQRELGLISLGERMLSLIGEDAASKRLEIAKSALNVHNEFLAIGLVDTTGQLITFTGALEQENLPNLSESEKTRRTFEQAKKANNIVIGEVYYFDEISNWILPIRVPLKNKKGELIAVNTSAIGLSKLIDELKSFNIDQNYTIHFVNGEFNTTQLLYPLDTSYYNEILSQNASIIVNQEMNSKKTSTFFEGSEKLSESSVIGVRTKSNSQNHYVEVFAKQEILWAEYKSGLFLILVSYLFVIVLLLLIFSYLRNSLNRYEKALALERDYSNNIIQSTSALVVGISSDHICTFMNPAAEEVTGYSRKEVVGKNWWKQMYPDGEYKQVERLFEEMPNGNVSSYEMQLTTKNGSKRIVSWNSIRLYDSKEKLTEIIGLGIDVTSQKNAENEVRAREANLVSIVESTNHGIALIDTDLCFLDFNQAFINHFKKGISIQLKKGDSVEAIIEGPDTELLIGLLKKSLEGEKLSEMVDYHSSNGPMYLSINFNPVYQGSKVTGVSLFIQDLTVLKKAQNELKRYSENLEAMVEERSNQIINANKELSRANDELKETLESLKKAQEQLIQAEKMASLGTLSAGVGHEINNPLNFIKGGVNALSNQLQNIDERVQQQASPFIDIINEGVNRATEIVKGLSHFSRQTSDQNEKCDIHGILDNCLLILHSKLKYKVSIEKFYFPDPIIITGNEGQLHQAFLNILSNAEQAIMEKGTIRITTNHVGNDISIKISDTGIGIPKENLKRISDPFFTTKEPGKGTGLGLSITYKIIDDHKGKISINSDLDKGTEVSIIVNA